MFEFGVSKDMKSMFHIKGVAVWKVVAFLSYMNCQGIENKCYAG